MVKRQAQTAQEGAARGTLQLVVPGWIAWGMVGLLAVLWAVKNLLLVQAGMLAPDFGLIGQGWHFNFYTMALACLGTGISGIFLGVVVSRRGDRASWLAAGLLLAGTGTGLLGLRHYANEVEPNRLVVREYSLRSSKLTEPLRILHFTDLQSGGLGPFEAAVLRRVRELAPDLICFTGDWLQPVPPATYGEEIPALLEMLKPLSPELGFWGVYGDTDSPWYAWKQESTQPLVMLGPGPERVRWRGGTLSVRGLGLFQSHYPEIAEPAIAEWLAGEKETTFTLLLGHAPDYALTAQQYGVDLCLAGHTHGGQIRIPGWGPLVIDSTVPREWAWGFRPVGGTHLSVSSGVGCNRHHGLPKMRINCPPELVLITVRPEAE